MNKEKISYYSLLSVGILASAIIIFAAMKYVLPVISPFIIAWVMASAVTPLAEKISERLHTPTKIFRLILSLALTLAVFGLIFVIVWQVMGALWQLLTGVDEGRIGVFLSSVFGFGEQILGGIIPEEMRDHIGESVFSVLRGIIASLAEGISNLAQALPGALFFLLVTVISLVYFSLDLDGINAAMRSLLPDSTRRTVSKVKRGIFSAAKKYFLSYLLIMLITYAELFVGFLVLRVSGAAVLALLVALLDILPVIGVGTVLVPWSIFSFAVGNHFMGIGLLVLFVVNTVVRQFSEPKIVGKSLNIHPILTLAAIYIGYALFGVLGLVLFPLTIAALGFLFREEHSAEVG